MKTLWLASWYPSKAAFLDGDFIERHAEAASLYHNVFIIHVTKYESLKGNKPEKEEKYYSDNFSTLIYYYPSYKKLGRGIDMIVSAIWFWRLHIRAYRAYVKRYGKPQGILVQVGLKAGIMALFFKTFFKMPFILFERWAGILEEAKPNFRDLSFIKRWWWKRILKKSQRLATVSEYFALSICRLYYKKKYTVIPNTIREHLFFPLQKKNDNGIFRFLHVSNMDYQKNFEDILRAFSILGKKKGSCELVVYGPLKTEIIELVNVLGLGGSVIFKGEVDHAGIASAMQLSNALILFSRYETFGNVIIEANACGLPVIVSDHPVFKEIIQEGDTGIIARNESPADLAEKMEWLILNYQNFNPEMISSYVRKKYNSSLIGGLFNELFNENFAIQK